MRERRINKRGNLNISIFFAIGVIVMAGWIQEGMASSGQIDQGSRCSGCHNSSATGERYQVWTRIGAHASIGIQCNICHTMHFSESHDYYSWETGLRIGLEAGGPYNYLLKYASSDALCLYCHDYNQGKMAPPVKNNEKYDAGGGDFSFIIGTEANNAAGHDIGRTGVTPPGSTSGPMELHCTSCHDPHGTTDPSDPDINIFRNLLKAPKGSGSSGLSVSALTTWGNRDFRREKIVYRSGFTQWCGSCHDDFHGTGNTGASSPWLRHPQDQPMEGGAGHFSWAQYVSENTYRLPLQDVNESRSTGNGPKGDDSGDTVFCLTCHRAHAGGNNLTGDGIPDGTFAFGLNWPTGDPQSSATGCKICHTQGN